VGVDGSRRFFVAAAALAAFEFFVIAPQQRVIEPQRTRRVQRICCGGSGGKRIFICSNCSKTSPPDPLIHKMERGNLLRVFRGIR
jgi:hypothetical protein